MNNGYIKRFTRIALLIFGIMVIQNYGYYYGYAPIKSEASACGFWDNLKYHVNNAGNGIKNGVQDFWAGATGNVQEYDDEDDSDIENTDDFYEPNEDDSDIENTDDHKDQLDPNTENLDDSQMQADKDDTENLKNQVVDEFQKTPSVYINNNDDDEEDNY